MMHAVLSILSLIVCVAANFDDQLFTSNDPKNNYFRYVRTYTQQDYENPSLEEVQGENVPQPYGFDIYYPKHSKRFMRFRRGEVGIDSTSVTPDRPEADDKLLNIDESLKPLELDILETDKENSTEETEATDIPNDMVINDFIRFKRDLTEDTKNQKRAVEEFEVDSSRLKREPQRNGKMLLSDSKVLDTNREPRGAVQEKWVKQPYSIQVDNRDRTSRFNDDVQNGGEPPNAPRVHFVTQRRSESIPPLVYHSYEARDREGRSRDFTRQRDIDLERGFEPAYYSRLARHYNSQLGGGRDYPTGSVPRSPEYFRNYERDSLDRDFRGRDYGRDYDRDLRDKRYYGPDRHHEEDRPISSITKQKRIIYYATLPDIIPGDRRDRDRDRDFDRGRERSFRRGYHDNRVNSDDRYGQPVQAINYRFRNKIPFDNHDGAGAAALAGDKSRYDEAATAKSGSYPTKVFSADVSVRALKKTPESRVYSEVGRRYPVGYQDDSAAYEGTQR